ncbi:uncharacterized protein LOC125943852 [Dermacentor silvarum]|uniref:uncharacterized protein LOC125943852 n=1 Tax=Dermacentor silvarum TaxID=543639 RepID=UPI002101CBFA|nr:uncharacterized protein LOC125943852 [Dermacentor silvarum]
MKLSSCAALLIVALSEVASETKKCNNTCVKKWCSEVTNPEYNTHLNNAPMDPELTMLLEEIKPKEESPKKEEPQQKEPEKKEGEGHDVSDAFYYEGAGYNLGCADSSGRRYANGKGCVLDFRRGYYDKTGRPTPRCLLGKCKDGRCLQDGYGTCAVY